MEQRTKPVLTIGMIVKNEIRCLERCLKALQPLRDAVPCELIIADTGSDDGTKEVAEKYADLVFDFPWINDFAAARNSVIDRASGEWFLTVDADEYLDADCQEIVNYLNTPRLWKHYFCGVIIRNYALADMVGPHTDFMAVRLVRLSGGMRYVGTIHEMWTINGTVQVYGQRKTVFHHDGYVNLGNEKGAAKRKRNMDLLKKELEKSPTDLKILMQCIDSSVGTEDQLKYIRDALRYIEEKTPGWEQFGPVIFRSAVNVAQGQKLPELWDWIHRAEELFPDSLYIRLSINRAAIVSSFQQEDIPEVIRRGTLYQQAAEDYTAGRFNPSEMCISTVDAGPSFNNTVYIFLADAYFKEKQYEKARDILLSMDGSDMDTLQVSNYMSTMLNLHAQTPLDMSQQFKCFWQQICAEKPKKEWAVERKTAIRQKVASSYTHDFCEQEDKAGHVRHAYTLFLPLKDECELGIAAAILEADDAQEIEDLLGQVKQWDELPVPALARALEFGIKFPLPGKTWNMEELDVLAAKLAQEQKDMAKWIPDVKDGTDLLTLSWAKALIMAVVKAGKWEDPEHDLILVRTFANIEKQFLYACYVPDLLRQEALFVLPPMHRFGWYCAQAFDALDGGDPACYVRHLREGLAACEGMKDMVEFLFKHTPQLQAASSSPSQELLELADKVRTMLSAYDPSDPTAAVIKQTPAYRKVAYLIEGIQAPVFGGLAQ